MTNTKQAKTRSRPNSEYVLYAYGEPVAMSADGDTSYFGTDILGSVRSVTDKYGNVKASYEYDAFGTPYLSNLENDVGFGYCGKVYDSATGLYDYGFRDYAPNSARFTTVDPVRDGSNWFSYCMNDAVNYVDLFGLTSNDICYTVQPGDCVWKIADKYDCTTQQVIDNNNFSNPNLIHLGDKIYIPVATPATASDTGSTISVATPSNNGSSGNSSNGSGAGNASMGGGSSGSSFISTGISYAQAFGAGFVDGIVGDAKAVVNGVKSIINNPEQINDICNTIVSEVNDYFDDPAAYITDTAVAVYDTIKQGVSDFIDASPEEKAYILGGITEKAAVAYASAKALGAVNKALKGGTGKAIRKSGANNVADAARLKEYYKQAEKYGTGSIRELENGKFRFYEELKSARTQGEMAGARHVREWDPYTGVKRDWYETLDHNGNIRQVRLDPNITGGAKIHYMFDAEGNYTGNWIPKK